MSFGVIYKRENISNGKVYIGQTRRNPKVRWGEHVRSSFNPNSSSYSSPLCKAIRKYGEDNFLLEILSICETQEELYEKEKYFADLLKSWSPEGYNLKAGSGPGSVEEETRKKMSERILGSKNPMFGKKHSSSHTKRQSKAQQGRILSQETKKKQSTAHKGKTHTQEATLKSAYTQSKSYSFLSPSGEFISIKGLRKFCREHLGNLDAAAMSRVTNGKQVSHKGWRKASA